jgi:hypothetical protein
MVGGQTVAQPHGQIECLGVVHGFEGSFHVHQYTITDARLLFSDKLLVGCVMVNKDMCDQHSRYLYRPYQLVFRLIETKR